MYIVKVLLAAKFYSCKMDVIFRHTYTGFLERDTMEFCYCSLLDRRDIRVKCHDREVMETIGTGLRTWYGNI
jgi:hypothetical protein